MNCDLRTNQSSPHHLCVADSRSVLEDRRSGSVHPYTSACLLWCPWHLLLPLSSPNLHGEMFLGYILQTSKSSWSVPGLHDTLSHNTEDKKENIDSLWNNNRHISEASKTVVTYIYHIRDVMDVVFGHQCIGGGKIEKIIIASLCAFQFVFKVLGLSLGRKRKWESHRSRTLHGSLKVLTECFTSLNQFNFYTFLLHSPL